ncbi:uncharacterized protein F5147DRAFT_727168 [Suillus discolor]|uniref:Ubiquitin-like protease family profile domain-containing protein n=1 Tax=Suillus discolor TaxID=1912936 RepID=A0A9P7ETD0_9AGAM|nr:uncharacterized protein F5147DRAFT_727168 [Suillus discolor]KAG2088061.1 hypothetical protein F5147DRAFT_727168 [Suillus discolor]
MSELDSTRPAIQLCLDHLDRLEGLVRGEIQETRRRFFKLLDNSLSDVATGHSYGYDSTVDPHAEFYELDAIINGVISASFATFRDRFFVQQPAPHSTSFGVTGGMSEGTHPPLGQPLQGPLPDGTHSTANYSPVTQPFVLQPQHSTYSEAPSVYQDPRTVQSLPGGAYPVGEDAVQVPAGPTESEVEHAGWLEGDIDMCDSSGLPKDLLVDDFCIPSEDRLPIVPDVVTTRIRPARDGFHRQIFDPKDIACLNSPTARLNDGVINGCAAILYSQFKIPAVNCAILSTFDITRIRSNEADDRIWRNARWTSYWEKDVWILPIHRTNVVGGHWVICIIYLKTKEMHMFDSLADEKSWEPDVNDIMTLIDRYLTIARQRHSDVQIDLEGWQGRMLNVAPCQSNAYDCGLWILAAMIAVLRGRHFSNLDETQMSNLRQYLLSLILSVPTCT